MSKHIWPFEYDTKDTLRYKFDDIKYNRLIGILCSFINCKYVQQLTGIFFCFCHSRIHIARICHKCIYSWYNLNLLIFLCLTFLTHDTFICKILRTHNSCSAITWAYWIGHFRGIKLFCVVWSAMFYTDTGLKNNLSYLLQITISNYSSVTSELL